MTDADWAAVTRLAETLGAEGVHVTAGQVASQLLHDAIAEVAGRASGSVDARRGGGRLVVAERVEPWGGRARSRSTDERGAELSVLIDDAMGLLRRAAVISGSPRVAGKRVR
jgi:hypothetical protein